MSRIPAIGAQRTDDAGVVPAAALILSAQPVTTNTIGIGGDTYEFVTAAGAVASDTNIAVAIGGSAAATRANLIAAINATDADNAHANITLTDLVTPALANGTESVVADEVGSTVRIRYADGPGGTPKAGDPSIVLAEAITDAADVWNVGNVNLNTLAGAALARRYESTALLTVTAAMVTNGVELVFPFAVAGFALSARASTGGARTGVVTDTAVASGSKITLAFNGGAAPAWQATDVLTVVAWST